MKKEIWKDIPGYNDYKISNVGRLISYKCKIPKIVNGSPNNKGYITVKIRNNNGHCLSTTIHRLVMLAFVGVCPNDMEVCHADGDVSNNCIDNLRYDTRVNNLADRYIEINTNIKEKVILNELEIEEKTCTKLNQSDQIALYNAIRLDFYKLGIKMKSLASKYNLPYDKIRYILNTID